MAADTEEFIFNNALCERVKTARERMGWTASVMATALGVPAERYRKYENRSPLPAYLMERFTIVTGTDLDWLITGRTRAAARPVVVPEIKKRA